MGNAFLLAVAGICEELFFRGFLLFSIKRYSVLISAGIFSLLHLLNLFTYDTSYVLLQLLVAFSAGVAYGYIAIFTKSIMPCIILHILTNITSSGNDDFKMLIACSGFYFVYTALYVYINKNFVEEKNEIIY